MIRKILLFSFIGLLMSSCGNRENKKSDAGSIQQEQRDTTIIHEKTTQPIVNVYIENSGSMDGFVNGFTEFKGDIGKLLVDLKYHYGNDNVHIYFIRNDKPIGKGQEEELQVKEWKDSKTDIADFAKAIDLTWKEDKSYRGSNTNLNNIFRRILDSTDRNTISILVSDCIYSIGNGETIQQLNAAKNTTYDAFLMASKRNGGYLATTVVKMKSFFNGKYYPFTGDRNAFKIIGELPYYICVISNQDNLADFNKDIKIQKLDGFDNKYVIDKGSVDSLYYATLGSQKLRKGGSYRTIKKDNYHSFENVSFGGSSCSHSEKQELEFAVAIDMKRIDVDVNYLLDTSNYVLSNNLFRVKEVCDKNKKKQDIYPAEWDRIKDSSSHIIVLQATETIFSIPKKDGLSVKIGLKKQMPQWIEECNTLDDTSVKKLEGRKSFGLKYWIEGIAEAYEKMYAKDKNYFEIEIKIKK